MANGEALKQYYANHRWFVVGGLAALAGAIFTGLQLRKGASLGLGGTVGASTSASVGSGPTQLGAPYAGVSIGVSDLTSAMQAGATAAASGLQMGADLGTQALQLGGQVVGSESDALAQLAASQAGEASTLSDMIGSLLGWLQPPAAITPTSPGQAAPQPTPVASPSLPGSGSTKPAPVAGPYVPSDGAAPVATPTPAPSAPAAGTWAGSYRVKAGDNLTSIARHYGTTWPVLYSHNTDRIGSNPNMIRVGLVLRVPS